MPELEDADDAKEESSDPKGKKVEEVS